MTVDAGTLEKPHEELLELKVKADTASYNLNKRRYTEFPLFFGRAKALDDLTRLEASHQESDSAYKEAFNKVLKEQHSVDPEDIIDLGDMRAKHHKFTVLIDRKIREMSAIPVGKRIVFFLDDTALGESEKASYVQK